MNWLHPVTIAFAIGVLLSALPLSASASGDDELELTDRQRELNRQGVEALDADDFDTAIDKLEASLELGELNVTHANLGRAFQRSGDCDQAARHFRHALEAPTVDQPAPERIAELVDDYLDELRQDCPGYLEVDCKPPDIELFIDGEGPKSCREEPRELMAGTYELRGEYDQHVTETTVAVDGLETSTARLSLQSEIADASPGDDSVQPPPEPEPTDRSSPWLWLAGSGAALAGGIVLDTVPAQARNYEVNAINFVPVGLYAASAGLGWVGIRSLLD